MFNFDPNKETANVKIQINPNRYLGINGKTVDGAYKTKKVGKGKFKSYWEGHTIWVPKRIADTIVGREDPVAKIVDTRNNKDASENKEASEIKKNKRGPGRPRKSKNKKSTTK